MTKEDLTRDDDGPAVMSLSNYDNLIKRKHLNVLRPGKGLGCYALIDYETMPERFKERFEAKYGDPKAYLLRQQEPALVISERARTYYTEALRADGKHFTAEQIEQKTASTSPPSKSSSTRSTPRCWSIWSPSGRSSAAAAAVIAIPNTEKRKLITFTRG